MGPALLGSLCCIAECECWRSSLDMCSAYRASAAFPSTGRPAPSRALRHPWLRLSQHQRGTS